MLRNSRRKDPWTSTPAIGTRDRPIQRPPKLSRTPWAGGLGPRLAKGMVDAIVPDPCYGAISSVGQSACSTRRKSQVQVLYRPVVSRYTTASYERRRFTRIGGPFVGSTPVQHRRAITPCPPFRSRPQIVLSWGQATPDRVRPPMIRKAVIVVLLCLAHRYRQGLEPQTR